MRLKRESGASPEQSRCCKHPSLHTTPGHVSATCRAARGDVQALTQSLTFFREDQLVTPPILGCKSEYLPLLLPYKATTQALGESYVQSPVGWTPNVYHTH